MGWLSAIGSIFSWLGGDGFAASLARVAIGFGLSRYLSSQNDSASASNATPTGTRQQIQPATENTIPVAYGDSYFGGTVIDVQMVNNSKELYAVIALCEVTGDIYSTSPGNPAGRTASNITIDDIYISNQKITWMADGTTVDYTTDDTGVVDTNPHGLVGIYLYKGNSNSPMLPCSSGTTTPIAGTLPPAAYSIMPGWTASSLCQNTIFAVVKLNYDPSKGLHTIPQLKFHVRNTLNKPGDVLHDYMTNEMYGAAIPEAQINNASITALNTYADESITLGTYDAQPRYRINGLVQTSNTNLSNMEKLASAGGSFISYDITLGKWAVVVNKLTTKTLEFNDSNVIGAISVSGSALESFYNSVQVQFPYAVLKDQSNYVRVDLPTIYQNANEPGNTLQLSHDFVNNVVQATVLGNLELRQSREDLVIVFTTDYSKYNVQIGDVVGLTNSVYGWASKQFKIIRVKKTESDSGQLTVELTGQSYNADVYTVEDITDFIPLIGVGHSIPSSSPIATPIAPTISSATISSQPSFTITGTVPAGVVTEMEFWYTKDTATDDALRNYTMLGTMRAENSGAFNTGDTPAFKTVLLTSGTYYFKVRAANASGSSLFSPPSISQPYTYVQAPDVLPYNTPVIDAGGSTLPSGLDMGLLLAYLATKLNWFGPGGILSGAGTLASIFGLSGTMADAVTGAVAADAAAQAAGANVAAAQAAANNAATAATEAQTQAAQAASDAAAAKAAAEAAGAILEPMVSVEDGHVFPCLFGDGPEPGPSTRAGIFTHDNLVFANTQYPNMKPENVVTKATVLNTVIQGRVHYFYNIPGSETWSNPPVYNQSATDKYSYNSGISLYYSTATYVGGSLDTQSWSPWTLIKFDNGVRGHAPGEPIITTIWTNPPPEDADYIVDENYDTDAYGNLTFPQSVYDPFKPNVQLTVSTPATDNTKEKLVWLSVDGSVPFSAGAGQLIAFGTSVFALPSGTPFSNNTAFGHVANVVRQAYPDAIAFREVASNGSRFVGIEQGSSRVFWSDDGANWNRIDYDMQVTNSPSWIHEDNVMAPEDPFLFVKWDGTRFFLYQLDLSIAHSTDGVSWNEVHVAKWPVMGTTDIIVTDGHYLAYGPLGIQTSADGMTWTDPVMPSIFGGVAPTTAIWDGSKFLVGSSYSNGSGSAVLSSTDGLTWVKEKVFNDPSLPMFLSESQNAILSGKTGIVGGISSLLP